MTLKFNMWSAVIGVVKYIQISILFRQLIVKNRTPSILVYTLDQGLLQFQHSDWLLNQGPLYITDDGCEKKNGRKLLFCTGFGGICIKLFLRKTEKYNLKTFNRREQNLNRI